MTDLSDVVTAVIVSRDHADYLGDCLKSVAEQLPRCAMLLVDVGSKDDSVKVALRLGAEHDLDISVIRLPRTSTTIDVARHAVASVQTPYMMGVSADDALGDGYGSAVAMTLARVSEPVFLNFDLVVIDSAGKSIGMRSPKWSDDPLANRMRMLLGNPGTAPGAVYPVVPLRDPRVWDGAPDSLIEDYWLWAVLLAKGIEPIVARGASVCYRRHPGNSSQALMEPLFVRSLAISAGISLAMVSRVRDLPRSMLGVARFCRSIPVWRWGVIPRSLFQGFKSVRSLDSTANQCNLSGRLHQPWAHELRDSPVVE